VTPVIFIIKNLGGILKKVIKEKMVKKFLIRKNYIHQNFEKKINNYVKTNITKKKLIGIKTK